MFKRVAADLLGISDIGAVIKPEDYDKVDSDDYVLHEENEKIYFLIKSKTDEYCFTNLALIHLDGTSAISKKRTLRRYPYSIHKFTHVLLETAGTVDLDVEIKFTLGSQHFSIDVNKKHIEELKDLYKALIKIEEVTYENDIIAGYANRSLDMTSGTLSRIANVQGNLVEQFKEINQAAFMWLVETHKDYKEKDFGYVFEKFINQ
ncbi:PH domain-containing protein [Paenibacillus sepulcri]|uniref:PH domain-containing protein n=1 Tax=Paenibacillus sepulcri TaxID=359917 RepID=A0ABS7BYC3_9BACL|nr:PH domain-containing protein [Paenibacillus sepulcri]